MIVIKAGDQVWSHMLGREMVVATVDHDKGELASGDEPAQWMPAASCTLQVEADHDTHYATLVRWARDGGRRGMVARRELAALWSSGKLRRGAT